MGSSAKICNDFHYITHMGDSLSEIDKLNMYLSPFISGLIVIDIFPFLILFVFEIHLLLYPHPPLL